ncbi:phage portal protein [Sandarakinorhabdus sp.]|uniref:phage portal protein n=1 Tax=Sandarakinorhabdus sp. TaxID=1916663 RepID=UPI00333E9DFC
MRTKAAAPGSGPPAPRIPVWATPVTDAAGSFAGQVRAAYLDNPVAARAIRMVTEGAGGAPITSNPPGHPALALLGSCGFGASGPSLIETLAGHLLLHGNAYVDVACGDDGLPAALFALRPERVSIEVDSNGWPAAHLYRAGGAVRRYPVGAGGGLLHIRSFHPLDDHHGAGCLSAASAAVAVHNAATRWNKALLDNAARPSGALMYQPGDGSTLSPAQYDRLRDEMEAAFSGAANAGRPMLLEGGLNWQALSLSPAEMDFAGMREAAARDIALALGVPPLLLGLKGDNTHANYREANVALWRQTLLPLLSRLLGALAAHLGWWWPGLSLAIDRDGIPALAEDRERLWASVNAADFLEPAEKRRILGLEEQAA